MRKLRFADPVESEFQRDYGEKSLPTVRAGLILGALLYAAFAFVDYWALPETRGAALRIRFLFAIPILVGTLLWKNVVCIRVSDDGRGIDSEVIKLLFVPTFKRTGTRVKAGMGLFVSHQIVEKHGGRILVASETGRGTAVTIKLPRFGPPGVA